MLVVFVFVDGSDVLGVLSLRFLGEVLTLLSGVCGCSVWGVPFGLSRWPWSFSLWGGLCVVLL